MTDANKTNIAVPIAEKVMLTVHEAAAYSSIGVGQIRALLRDPNCSFVLRVGNRTLVKRKEFETFLANTIYITPSA